MALLSQLGIHIPLPAWQSDVAALHQQIIQSRVNGISGFLDRDLAALTSNLAFQTSVRAQHQDVPAWLAVQEQSIRARISDDEDTLKRYRAQLTDD